MKRLKKLKIPTLITFLLLCNSILFCGNIHFLTLKNLIGEELKYRFSFFIFRKAAIVKLEFKHLNDNLYEATLNGQTKGIIGMFTAFRKDIYISKMFYDNKSKRLVPLKFIKSTQIGEKIRKSIYIFDYKNDKIIKTKEKFVNSKLEYKKTYEIKFTPPIDDYLSVAYNFRLGVFGFPNKSHPIKIKILPEKKKKKFITIYYVNKKKDGIMLKAKVTKDIIKTKNNIVYGILNKKMIPVKGILPGVPIFGNIKAYLISLKYKKIN